MSRFVFRRLAQSPLFTVITLITLAIGIGATTAIFSVVEGVLLKPLPYPQAERLAGVWLNVRKLEANAVEICASMYFLFREQGHAFQDIGAYSTGSVSITRMGNPEQVQSLWVTDGVLPLLGAKPIAGRLFTRRDDTDGSPRTAVLTYGYWQRRFGGAASAVGRRIIVDGNEHEVIGVLPRQFRFLDAQAALVLPLQFNRSKAVLGNFSYRGIARLRPGVTMAQANADVARLIPVWLKTFPPPPGFSAKLFEDAGIGPNVRPLMQDVVGDVASVLWVLMGTIAVVLLIACANVANLLLVRAEGRQHEMAIRSALGASWRDLAGELLTESLVLGLAGGVLGLAVAFGAQRLLVAIAPTSLPRLNEIGIDPWVLLFTLVVSVGAGLLFGMLPVLKYAGVLPGTGLRDSNRTTSAGRERHRTRNALAVAQIALALVLLISSGLMLRTFHALRRVEPGFTHPEQVLAVRIFVPDADVKDAARVVHMDQDLLAKLQAISGVQAAGLTSSVTMDGHNSGDILFAQDHPLAEGKIPPVRRFKFVGPGFFHAVGRRFLAGRDFTWPEVYAFRPVTIVSANLARELWGSPANALGKRVREGMNDDWREVIGVVGDEYDDGPQKKPPTVVYWPFLMSKFWGENPLLMRSMTFLLRSPRAGSVSFFKEVQKTAWSVASNSPLAEVRTLGEIFNKATARTSFTLVMLAIAGGMALLLGLVGIYGVISYSVSQRRREIGIRMALGARERHVSGIFLQHGLQLSAVGAVLGLAAAAALTRLMSSLLFHVSSFDLLTYALGSGLMLGAAMLATYIPARRAIAVDPAETLRAE